MSLADQYFDERETCPWWDKSVRSTIHEEIWKTVEHLVHEQPHYEANDMHLLRMYSNRLASAFFGQDFAAQMDSGQVIKFNTIKSCVDTTIAQIAAERSRCMHLVQGGDRELQRKALANDKFVLGIFMETNRYAVANDVFRDGDVWASGFEKWYTRGNKIMCERVPSTEVVFDDNECRYGAPRSLYQIKDVDANQLADRFKKKRQAIRGSKILREEMYDFGGLSRPVTAIEAWHLPSGPKATDGVHAIVTSDAVCLVEVWKWNFFPFHKWDWVTAPFGYRGMGLVEDLSPIQIEMNFVAQKIQRIYNLAAGVVWTEKGSQTGRLDNRDISVRTYKGRPPVLQQLGSVGGEFFQHIDRLYGRAYEQSGISQMAATGAPAGVESGEARRVLYDISNRRFRHVSQRWADGSVEAAKQVIRCAEEIIARGGDIEVVGPGDDYIENLSYRDIRLPENSYLIKRFPVALLPDEPAGKLEVVSKLMQMVGPERAPELMGLLTGIPDLESIVGRMTAAYDAAESTVQRVLETGDYEPPRPGMNLQLLRDIAVKELNKGYFLQIPEERLAAVQRLLDDIGFLEDQMAPPPPVPQEIDNSLPGVPPSPEAQAIPPTAPTPVQ